MARPFAAFDIDGTVIRWQLYHALADELVREGHLDRVAYERVREARMTWKRRASDSAFIDYEEALVSLVDTALPGISVTVFNQACQVVMREYRDQAYTYTRQLIKHLKAQDYLLFAISASQAEIVGMFAEYYGFDDYGGSEYEVKEDYFTGRKLMVLRSGKKPEYLKELATKHAADWRDSIAVGDSESDIPMLEIVERPIAFNPTKDLFNHARQAGWQVVVERKNMVYKLEPRDGTYLLAQADA